MKSFCKWLENEDLLEAALIQSISGPRRRDSLPDVASEADMKLLCDGEVPTACPERDRVILELLYGGGLRVAELCGLNLDDFRDEDVILVRGKGKKERLVILLSDTAILTLTARASRVSFVCSCLRNQLRIATPIIALPNV